MKIKRLKIDGFRCFLDFEIVFEDGLTVVVGENDCGKTSLMDCLRIITQNASIDNDDFNIDKELISLEIEIENYIFEKKYQIENEVINSSFIAKPTLQYLEGIREKIEADDFQIENESEYIRRIAKEFGLTVRSNSNDSNLKNQILEKIIQNSENGDLSLENSNFPQFNSIQLDGKRFENVPSFFKELFLKEKQSNIWKEKVADDKTIEEFINDKIKAYSDEITNSIKEKGILDKFKLFLKDLSEVKIEPIYQPRDLNIDAKVRFLENGKEINLDKKGDGTKRRISMALLEFKKDEKLLEHDASTIYLLDEPDTHLHVKAQIDLLDTLEAFADKNQVIVTTHSPFLINAVKPNQLRLIEFKENKSIVRHVRSDDIQEINYILKSLGVENIYLFFARHIILVEGETEERFIQSYYLKKKGRTINSNLVKIINIEGCRNIQGFSKAVSELHSLENIYIVYDNDSADIANEVIENFQIPLDKVFIIGAKEFEDGFSDETLYGAWECYLMGNNKNIPTNWSVEKICKLRNDCQSNGSLKFSKKLRSLNEGSGEKMTKPIFGEALGEFCKESDLPDGLKDLFSFIDT